MSDTMLFGVLKMPYEMAMRDEISRIQFYQRVQELVARVEAQPEQEPTPIYYMRDNHTFKELSADVSTALVEIESEFNAGYTYGSLFSKRKGFPWVHASGSEHRLAFFLKCKTVLEKWADAPPAAQPEQRKPLTDEQIKAALTVAVQSGAVSWLGFEKDENNRYTIPSLSPQHYQIARVAHNIKE
jgi:hypothetical protein